MSALFSQLAFGQFVNYAKLVLSGDERGSPVLPKKEWIISELPYDELCLF